MKWSREALLGFLYVGCPFLALLLLIWFCLNASRTVCCRLLCAKCDDSEEYEMVGYSHLRSPASEGEEPS